MVSASKVTKQLKKLSPSDFNRWMTDLFDNDIQKFVPHTDKSFNLLGDCLEK